MPRWMFIALTAVSWVLCGLTVIAMFVMFIAAAWGADERWVMTAFILMFVVIIFGGAGGMIPIGMPPKEKR